MIERYLVDLATQLASHGIHGRRARRVVAEARDHLTELAADRGEEAAVADFGPASVISAGVARAVQPVLVFRAALVVLGALALFALPYYGIPENTLPPAPWDERPGYLTWKLYAAGAAHGVAVLAALIAVGAAWRRLIRCTLAALAVAALALATGASVGLIGAVQWAQAVPGSGLMLGLTIASTTGLTIVALVALAYAFRNGAKLVPLR